MTLRFNLISVHLCPSVVFFTISSIWNTEDWIIS